MLYSWMKSLVIYLVFSGLIINLAPAGNYKRYISFFSGLIIIIIAATPIRYIYNYDAANLDSIVNELKTGQEEYEGSDDIYNYYELGMNEAVKKTLKENGILVDEVVALLNENEELLSISVYGDGAVDEETIKNIISEVYNIENDSIYVIRQVKNED